MHIRLPICYTISIFNDDSQYEFGTTSRKSVLQICIAVWLLINLWSVWLSACIAIACSGEQIQSYMLGWTFYSGCVLYYYWISWFCIMIRSSDCLINNDQRPNCSLSYFVCAERNFTLKCTILISIGSTAYIFVLLNWTNFFTCLPYQFRMSD